jgi:hypothetical protein
MLMCTPPILLLACLVPIALYRNLASPVVERELLESSSSLPPHCWVIRSRDLISVMLLLKNQGEFFHFVKAQFLASFSCAFGC